MLMLQDTPNTPTPAIPVSYLFEALARASSWPLAFPLCRSMSTRPPLLLFLLVLLVPCRLSSFFALAFILFTQSF